MAEGSKFSKSVLHASEEIYDYNCSPCLDEGRYNEALKYCVSCKRYYCKKCVVDHNKFPALNAHRMQDMASTKKHIPPPGDTKVTATSMEPCEHHPDENVKMYCSEHAVVCCTVCIALDHRECEGVDYIPKIAKGVRASETFKKYIDNMEELKEKYEETKEEIQEEIRKITYIKDDILKDIEGFRKKIIAKLEELERKSLAQVNERYKLLSERMNVTDLKVEKFLEQIRENLQELDNKSEAAAFVCMKRESQNERIKEEIDRDINEFEGFSFSLDKRIQNVLDEADGLVKVDIPCKVEMKSKHEVKFKDDKYTCSITDMCILTDGTIVMTDSVNSNVKRFSGHFDKIGKIDINGRPCSICKISSCNEFIVTLHDRHEVQFIKYTAETMQKKNSFKVGVSCRGICRIDKTFLIACGGGVDEIEPGHIRKFDLSGNMLCIIEADGFGNRLFTRPRQLALSLDNTKIYVTDKYNGVIVLDKTGKKLGQYKHVNLKSVFSVSCSKSGLFVSGLDSENIQQFDSNNRFLGTAVNKNDGLKMPASLYFIETIGQMIISMVDSDEVLLTQIK